MARENMTAREREFAALGIENAEGIEQAAIVILPSGRQVFRIADGRGRPCWEVQPWDDNYWLQFCKPTVGVGFISLTVGFCGYKISVTKIPRLSSRTTTARKSSVAI